MTRRWREWRWPGILAVAVALLGTVTWANIVLHGRSRAQEVNRSNVSSLLAALHEESSLQWKTLAELNSPVQVARELGTLRAREASLLQTLQIGDLSRQVNAYHAVLDQELGLLGVGKTADALTLENSKTDPQYAALNSRLQQVQQDDEAAAGRANLIADLTLVIAMSIALTWIGLLLYRFERAHRSAAAANENLLAQQRRAIEQLNENEALIRHQAYHDALTGLPNRRLLTESIQGGCAEGQAILLIDLDDFKPVNDRLGHAAGDELLVAVAARLQASVRGEDMVARLGGDEFAVITPTGGADQARRTTDRIVAAVAEPFALLGAVEVRIGASVGFAVAGGPCDGAELLRRADHAMYDVKRARKERSAASA